MSADTESFKSADTDTETDNFLSQFVSKSSALIRLNIIIIYLLLFSGRCRNLAYRVSSLHASQGSGVRSDARKR
jgi:hypothetical protein